jgi:hypothetical protein
VRSQVSKKDWDFLRKQSYEKANNKCEICKGKGGKHPVECHEVWEYDDVNKIQKLKRLISLCPKCHQVKHPGLAEKLGKSEEVIEQIMKVNRISRKESLEMIEKSFEIFHERSKYKWILDISYLEKLNIEYKKK